MRAHTIFRVIPLLLAWPLAASAQEGVMRERLTFIGNTLEIEVLVEVPGTLRIIQGRSGEIEVTARAVPGIAGVGLSGADNATLQLSVVGAERVEYLVAVPEGAQIRIRLPGRPLAESLGTLQKSAVYTWVETRDRDRGER